MALLEADVNYVVVKDFIKSHRALRGYRDSSSLNAGQQVIKIVNEELTALMGGANAAHLALLSTHHLHVAACRVSGKPPWLASWRDTCKSRVKPLLAACDIYRPAAIKQLQVVGERVKVPVFEKGTQDPVLTSKQAVEHARYYGNDVLILDTAGRLHVDENLMGELTASRQPSSPRRFSAGGRHDRPGMLSMWLPPSTNS